MADLFARKSVSIGGDSGTAAPRPAKNRALKRINCPSTALRRLVEADGTIERHPRHGIRFTCDDQEMTHWIDQNIDTITKLVTAG